MTLLDVHHGLMAASAVVQAINRVFTTLAMVWLAWQMLFRSGLQWRWFRRPHHPVGGPVRAVNVSLYFFPEAGRFRRLSIIPKRDPDDWIVSWMWFNVRWNWIT